MSCAIALAGKGGSGKTTIAALLIRLLREAGRGSILAVDADPNSNLAEVLGLESQSGIGSIIDDIAAHPDTVPAGMTKDRFIEYKVQSIVTEADGFDILTMGRPEGPGCYCYANNVLRGVMEKLIKDYDYVIIDNEAGLEHLSRRTTRRADFLAVIAEPTAAGLRAAGRINALIGELNIHVGRKSLLVNCARQKHGQADFSEAGLPLAGMIPEDEHIEDFSRAGRSLMELPGNSAALTALRKFGETIWA